jgi:2-(1,2-epoxy-1,2-dihydrophenyl)acetyl-CoA isomerase
MTTSTEVASSLGIHREGGVVVLTLDRPERRNAIDVPLWHALARAIDEIGERPEDRVLILTGAGSTFCAGGDLSGAGGADATDAGDPVEGATRAMRESVGAACLALHRLPKPTLAAVEGTAAGAGANLAFGCDLVLAGASARFGEVFVRRALPVDSGGSWLLPRLVGLQKAKELLFFGDWIGADEAAHIGLVNRLVAEGQALEEARGWAQRLAASSPRALAWIKRVLHTSFDASFEEALDAEARGIVDCVATPEFREAMQQFLDRGRG